MRFGIKVFTATVLICGAAWFFMPRQRTPENSKTPTTAPSQDPIPEVALGSNAQPALKSLPIDNPALANEQDGDNFDLLCSNEEFATALDLAKNGPEDIRADRLNVVFARWAQSDPEEALSALEELNGNISHTNLFRTIIDVWSAKNPETLANKALAMPEGDERNYAFAKATDNWSLQDPATMGEWLNNLPPSRDFDRAIADLLAKTDSVNRSPEVAMSWMEGINDPELRRGALEVIARQWAESDLPSAEKYVANVSWITPAQRDAILQSLTQPSKLEAEMHPADPRAFN